MDKILIIGGGIAGLSLAAVLGRAGIPVELVDNFSSPPLNTIKPSGRTVALQQRSINVLKATGAWELCAEHTNPLKAMRIIDDSMPGQKTIDAEFPSSVIGQEQFGFNVSNDILRAALSEVIKNIPSVTTDIPNSLSNYEVRGNHVVAILKDGSEITGSLIVGADGRNSKVRELAGITFKTHDYGQSAVTCLINHSRSHNDTSAEFHRPGGPLALVPLQGNQSAVVWVEPTPRAEEIMKLRKQDFIQTLEDATKNILGGLTLEAGPECWPLSSIKATSITGPRLALMAEAAHVMSPITAQGLNLSLRDAAALAETIADAMRLGLDPGSDSTLARYAKRRKLDITTRIFGVDGMNKIVSHDMEAIRALRRAGLKTIDSIPVFKNFAAQQALAPDIDEGRLAMGQPL
jgi:2-octaprenyl-6-methoxyphenol hydroxylase